jgi:serine protease Do
MRFGGRFILVTAAALAATAVFAADDDPRALEQAFAAALKHVAPSLASIEVEWKPGKAVLPGAPGRPAFQRGNGPFAGVIISPDGLVATSDFSVNSDVKRATVKLADGRSFDAEVLGADVSRGIQLLRIDARTLPVPEFAQNGEVKVGRWALACGVNDSGSPTLSVGIVSATERIQGRAIQIDASTNPANYGGALIDVQGRLMGIVTPLTPGGTSAGVTLYDSGIAFAVPIGDIVKQLAKLKAGENIQAAFLGISFDTRKMTGGALVQNVLANTGAEKAGMKAGDVIVEFNGVPIHASFKLLHVIGKCRVGDTVTFKVERAGKTEELTATLGARPAAGP